MKFGKEAAVKILINSKDSNGNKNQIMKAFKIFWDSKPTEKEFGEIMSRITLYPEMLYYIATHEL